MSGVQLKQNGPVLSRKDLIAMGIITVPNKDQLTPIQTEAKVFEMDGHGKLQAQREIVYAKKNSRR